VKDDLVGEIEFDLIDEEEVDAEITINDVFGRDTAIPAPGELSATETIRPLPGEGNAQPPPRNNPKIPPPPPMRSTPPPMRPTPIAMKRPDDLEFDSFDAPIDVFARSMPSSVPVYVNPPRPAYGRSEMPTAPPVAHLSVPEQAKRSMPAPSRAQRPRFMTETARNPPADLEQLARATRPGVSSANGSTVPSPTSEPIKDSALDFVDGFDPLLESLAPPMSGLQTPAPASNMARVGPKEMQDCYAVGDFSRALSIAEEILARTPDDAAVRRCAQNCRDVLTQMFAARIGPLDQVITVVVSPDEVQWLSLDHRAGFLLSLVDGQSTVDEILDISGMTRLDALKIIFDLMERQVVRLA
jgi:hypothetical protein